MTNKDFIKDHKELIKIYSIIENKINELNKD